MDKETMEKKQSESSNDRRGNVRYLWVLAGAYLIYLAWQQAQLLYHGEGGHPVISIVSGVLFVAVGSWMIYREWQEWRYEQAHKDDPETWGGQPDSPEELPDGGGSMEAPDDMDDTEDVDDTEEDQQEENEESAEKQTEEDT